MASINKVTLIGNCGRDPEIRYMGDGKAVTNVSIATTSKRKNRDTGEVIEDTQWHRVVFYDRLAEVVGQYVKKGSQLYVEGRLKYGKYTDQQTGVEKNTTDIVATEMTLLGGRDRNGGDQGGEEGNRGAPAAARPAYSAPPAQQRQAPQRHAAPPPSSSGFDDMDDDIPF